MLSSMHFAGYSLHVNLLLFLLLSVCYGFNLAVLAVILPLDYMRYFRLFSVTI